MHISDEMSLEQLKAQQEQLEKAIAEREASERKADLKTVKDLIKKHGFKLSQFQGVCERMAKRR